MRCKCYGCTLELYSENPITEVRRVNAHGGKETSGSNNRYKPFNLCWKLRLLPIKVLIECIIQTQTYLKVHKYTNFLVKKKILVVASISQLACLGKPKWLTGRSAVATRNLFVCINQLTVITFVKSKVYVLKTKNVYMWAEKDYSGKGPVCCAPVMLVTNLVFLPGCSVFAFGNQSKEIFWLI